MGPSGAGLPLTSRAGRPGGPGDRSTGMRSTSSAISVRGLAKAYRAGLAGCSAQVHAVRGVDLDVACGEAIGVLGPRGSGKSTLLLCLAGLVQPDSGTVGWFGRGADAAGRPPGIAYVPERAPHYAFMTVREAVEYHVLLRDAGSDGTPAAVERALEAVGLGELSARRIGELPWTVGPLVSLAQALVEEPRVLLLDETLTGLDPRIRRDAAAMLRDRMERGMTIVATGESLDALDGLATRVVVMIDGRLSEPVDPGVLRRPRFLEIAIAAPMLARRIFGARVAEEARDGRVLRLTLDGTTPEALLADCTSYGIEVEGSRITSSGSAESVPFRAPPSARPTFTDSS